MPLAVSISVQANVIDDCASLAAIPHDPTTNIGVEFKDINGTRAVEVCSTAYRAHPKSGLVNYALSRAYNKLEDYESSLHYAMQSSELSHPVGHYVLGFHYEYGEGTPKNKDSAIMFYSRSSAQGFSAASLKLANVSLQRKDFDDALFFATSAIKKGNPTGHYTKGLVLIDMAENEPNKEQQAKLLLDAQASLLSARKAGIKTAKEMDLTNKKLASLVKQIDPQSTLFHDIDYIDRRNIDGNIFHIISRSEGSMHFSLLSRYSEANKKTLWGISIEDTGEHNLSSIIGVYVSSLPGDGGEKILFRPRPLNISKEGARNIGGVIDYKAVLLLKDGVSIAIKYKDVDGRDSTYNINITGDKKDGYKWAAVKKVINLAKQQDKNCCY
ncbi:MAG: hypothetical protein V7682_02855 [Cycloclasticus sp.]